MIYKNKEMQNKSSSNNIFKTMSSFDPDIISSWIMRFFIMLIVIVYGIEVGPWYFGIPYIFIAFYLIFIKFILYRGNRFIYRIEFDDDNQNIKFYYRANIFGKGKHSLPYSGLKLILRKTIISKSVYIKDIRKGKKGIFVGALNKKYIFGKKYWNKELWEKVVEKLKQIAEQNDKGIAHSVAP